MPKISAAVAAERRNRIIEAARACFAEHGIHVSVDEICARAGISKGAFYGYFKSKDAAIEALAQDHAKLIDSYADIESLEDLHQCLLDQTYDGNTASSRLELEAWTHGLKQPALGAAMRSNAAALTEGIAGVLKRNSRNSKRSNGADLENDARILAIFSMGLIANAAINGDKNRANNAALLSRLVRMMAR